MKYAALALALLISSPLVAMEKAKRVGQAVKEDVCAIPGELRVFPGFVVDEVKGAFDATTAKVKEVCGDVKAHVVDPSRNIAPLKTYGRYAVEVGAGLYILAKVIELGIK